VVNLFANSPGHQRNATDRESKFSLLPRDVPGRHDVALFPSAYPESSAAKRREDSGDEGGRAGSQESNLPQASIGASTETSISSAEGRIVGRQCNIWQVILALSKSRCVVVCGVGGVGKSTLCRNVAQHLRNRGGRLCERGVHTVRLRGVRAMHAAEALLRQNLEDSKCRGSKPEDTCTATGNGPAAEELWEAIAARLGERLLIMTEAEDLIHADPRGAICVHADNCSKDTKINPCFLNTYQDWLNSWSSCSRLDPNYEFYLLRVGHCHMRHGRQRAASFHTTFT